jgi:hypothetical protein
MNVTNYNLGSDGLISNLRCWIDHSLIENGCNIADKVELSNYEPRFFVYDYAYSLLCVFEMPAASTTFKFLV